MNGTAPPSRCQSRVNPTSGLGRSISSWLRGYREHPKWCKAYSSTQERLPEENDGGHEEPESRKAFQTMTLVREAASTAARACSTGSLPYLQLFPRDTGAYMSAQTNPGCFRELPAPCKLFSLSSPLAFSVLQGEHVGGQKLSPYFLSPPGGCCFFPRVV